MSAVLDHVEEAGPTRTRLDDLALVCSNCHRYKVKELAREDGTGVVDEIVVMAKAETLEICCEPRDSVVLIKKHLAGISAAD